MKLIVQIPAFNEEKVIVTTIERILASDYSNLEVLVIDDKDSFRRCSDAIEWPKQTI